MRKAPVAASLRAAVSAVVFCAFTVGFLGAGPVFDLLFTAVGAAQLFPGFARLAAGAFGGTAAVVVVIAALSAVLGRFYCSSLCPLGTAQDAASFLGHRLAGKKPFSFRPGLPPPLRAVAPILAVAAFAGGASTLAGVLDPYSLFGRFLNYALAPALRQAGNLLAPLVRNADLYWASDMGDFSPWAALAAAAAVAAVLAAAFLRGRLFCNSLCPVGACLGALNAAAPFRVRMDGDACVACGACARVCAAECVDGANRFLDASRCVSCLSCLSVCPTGALRYGRVRRREESADKTAASGNAPEGLSRRGFLKTAGAGGAMAALSLAAAPAARAAGEALPTAQPLEPASPPGSGSLARFLASCTGCGLCVAKCPSGVLRPSVLKYGPRGFLAPYLDYEASYCQYECTLCADLCPTGALRKMALPDKQLTQMGTAALVREKCIVFTKKTACGACAEHCPTGSVRMVPSATGIPEPVFDEAICVGCGACHHICPALPEKSITVAGKRIQGTALPPTKDLFGRPEGAPPEKAPDDEFPF